MGKLKILGLVLAGLTVVGLGLVVWAILQRFLWLMTA